MDHWDRRPLQDEAMGESLLRREVARQQLRKLHGDGDGGALPTPSAVRQILEM